MSFYDLSAHIAQTRSEVFAAALATICIASPTIEARLKELEPGRGRQAGSPEVQGAISIFAIADSVAEEQKQVHVANVILILHSHWRDYLTCVYTKVKQCL